jgi:outer membrane protein OmpA-like peptidoglycan-associated protein
MIRFIISLSLLTILAPRPAAAQGLNIQLDGGWQGTHYTLPNGKSQPQPGGSLGLGYSIRLGGTLDLLTGVTGGIYRTKATLQDGVISSTYQVDDAGSAFQYNVKATGYQETQRFYAVSVPLLLQYHTQDPLLQWYFDAGGKVVVPFGSSTQASAKQLALSGYYPDFNIDISNLPQHGFGTVNGWKANATTQLKPSAALSAATGVSFSLPPHSRLYIGVFADYGLTGVAKKGDSQVPLVGYDPTRIGGVRAGSVLDRPTTGTASLLSFGLQVRLSFGPGGRPGKTEKSPAQQPVLDTLQEDQRELIEEPVVFGLLGEKDVPEIQKKHLDEVAGLLKRFPALRVSITGHTCDGDNEPEDKTVGAERAKAVASYLRTKGIDAGRMDVSPVSETDAFEPFNPLANYRNRRAVIKIK